MTEQMAIERAMRCIIGACDETCSGYSTYIKEGCCSGYEEVAEGLQKALEEIQQYRAIGTVKEIKIKQAEMAVLSKRYLADLGELMEYQKIGTVAELKELEEKSVAKKPKGKGKFADLHVGLCSVCGEGVNSQMNYCDKCGTMLDWE